MPSRRHALVSFVRFSLVATLPWLTVLGGAPLAALPSQSEGLPPSLTLVNLLTNPDLDHGLGGWTVVGDVLFDSLDDQGGNPASGSANLLETPGQAAELEQCVNLPNFWRSVNLSLSWYTKSLTSNASSMAVVSYFSAPNCPLASLLSVNARTSGFGDNAWQLGKMIGVAPPLAAQSARVTFVTLNSDGTTGAVALLDSMFFGYTLAGTCGTDPTLLCVDNNRFQIRAQFAQPCNSGNGSNAAGVLDSAAGGFLWCFDPGNPEVFVKVLNACTPQTGNTYWVFLSGLTNVGVTVTVTDTQTGTQKTYSNPANTYFQPIFDTIPGLQVCP
jgi:hypothetical protein